MLTDTAVGGGGTALKLRKRHASHWPALAESVKPPLEIEALPSSDDLHDQTGVGRRPAAAQHSLWPLTVHGVRADHSRVVVLLLPHQQPALTVVVPRSSFWGRRRAAARGCWHGVLLLTQPWLS